MPLYTSLIEGKSFSRVVWKTMTLVSTQCDGLNGPPKERPLCMWLGKFHLYNISWVDGKTIKRYQHLVGFPWATVAVQSCEPPGMIHFRRIVFRWMVSWVGHHPKINRTFWRLQLLGWTNVFIRITVDRQNPAHHYGLKDSVNSFGIFLDTSLVHRTLIHQWNNLIYR